MSEVAVERRSREAGCGCGCDESSTCCALDRLTAPRFFCGQLLTDQDLNALLEWTRSKTRLARHREGWGVVCGLDVRCDPANAGGVIVAPGYARSCCGDDIVVAEDLPLDLSTACASGPVPCEDVRRRPRRPGDVRSLRTVEARRPDLHPVEPGEKPPAADAPQAVDVFASYAEDAADPQAALAHGACGETGRCEYARTVETARLSWAPGGAGDPVTAAAERWRAGYDAALDVLDAFASAFGTLDGENGENVRRWLVRWIDQHGLHHFCFARDRICAADEDDLLDQARVTEFLFWLVQDARNAVLQGTCHSCGADDAVPLARVWLGASDDPGARGCHVLAIDPYPPYRRPLSPAAWPAPLGAVNAAQVIWHRAGEACTRLADLGVRVKAAREWDPPATLAELRAVLACDPFVPCGEERTALTYAAEPLGARVVGLCADTAPPPEPPEPPGPAPKPLALELALAGPASAEVGGEITYTMRVANRSEVELTVSADDELGILPGVAVGGFKLAPEAVRGFELSYAPTQPGVPVREKVVATGRADDGRTVQAADTVVTKILGEQPPRVRSVEEVGGIGRRRAEQLQEADIGTLETFAKAEPELVRKVLGGSVALEQVLAWQEEARKLLG